MLNDAEIMTIAIVAAMYFGGNQALARLLLYEQGYLKRTISRSRLCRRLKRVQHQFVTLFRLLGTTSRMSWLTVIACSCRFAKPTQSDRGSRG
jgi:hypothetical protein